MKPDDSWQKLAAAARRAPPDDRDTAAPFGFATRVAAQAFSERRRPAPIFAQFSLRSSLRAFCAAGALAAVAAVTSYPAAIKLFSSHDAPPPSLAAVPAVAPAVPEAASATSAPAGDTSGTASSSTDDPVTDLVDLAS
jgi:hypothetical protein